MPLCRALIRRDIYNFQWTAVSVLKDELFMQWVGFRLGLVSGRQSVPLPKGIEHASLGHRFDIFINKVGIGKYAGMLSAEWMDSGVASEMLLIEDRAFTKLDPALFSSESIASRIVDYPRSAEEFLDYVGEVDWPAVVKCGGLVISRIPRKHFEKMNLAEVFMECPNSVVNLDVLQLKPEVIRTAVKVLGLNGLSEKMLAHPNFLPVFMELHPEFEADGDAAEFVIRQLLVETQGLVIGPSLSFMSSYSELVYKRIPGIIHEAVCLTIERWKVGSSAHFSIEELALCNLWLEMKRTADWELISMLTAGGVPDSRLPLIPRLFFQGVSFDRLLPYVKSRSDWVSLFPFYSKDVFMQHPDGRRFWLEREMGM